jgi:hypothetical protein
MSIARIVPKPTAQAEIQKQIIRMLADELDRARDGKISMMILITRDIDGKWGHEQTGVENFSEAIGKIEIMKQSWIAKYKAIDDIL